MTGGRSQDPGSRMALAIYCDHPACDAMASASVPGSEFEWALPRGWMRMVLRSSSEEPPVDVDLCDVHAAPVRKALLPVCARTDEDSREGSDRIRPADISKELVHGCAADLGRARSLIHDHRPQPRRRPAEPLLQSDVWPPP